MLIVLLVSEELILVSLGRLKSEMALELFQLVSETFFTLTFHEGKVLVDDLIADFACFTILLVHNKEVRD